MGGVIIPGQEGLCCIKSLSTEPVTVRGQPSKWYLHGFCLHIPSVTFLSDCDVKVYAK